MAYGGPVGSIARIMDGDGLYMWGSSLDVTGHICACLYFMRCLRNAYYVTVSGQGKHKNACLRLTTRNEQLLAVLQEHWYRLVPTLSHPDRASQCFVTRS